MCHHNLEVELGPRINFIVGENGSGKSAVLTALCLTLGANSRKTERSVKGIKGFIREGANFAKVEVTIRNVGPDALDPDKYGDAITVDRTINITGGAPFKIRNQWGKEVGSSRDALLRITDHFNIDVENPIVVMSQDASRQFLHSGKDSDKYKFFVKATLLEEIQNKLQYVKGQVAEMHKLIAEKEEELPQVQQEVDRLQDEANSFKKMEEYRATVEQLRNRLAWCEVYEAEQVSAQLDAELANYKDNVTHQLEKQLRESEATAASCKKEQDEAELKLKGVRDKAMEIMEAKKAKEGHQREMDRRLRRAKTEVMSVDNDIRFKQRNAKDLEESIAQARLSVEQQSQAKDASIERAISEAHERHAEAKRQLDEVHRQEDDLRRQTEAAQGEEQGARAAVNNLDGAIREADQNLRSAQQSDGSRILDFGQNMPRLAQMLQQHATKFSKPPVGPIGMHIKLKDATWALPMEEHFGATLGGYVVANMKDRAILDKMMRDCGCKPDIHVANFSRGKYEMPENKLPPSGLLTMMDVLEIEHPAIFNVLVDSTAIERVVLMSDEHSARTVVYGNSRAANVKEAYTLKRKLWQKGQSQFENPFRRGLRPRLATDKSALVNQFSRQKQALQQEMTVVQARLNAARQKRDGLNSMQNEIRSHKRDAIKRFDHAEVALRAAKEAAEDRGGPAQVDVYALEEELADCRAMLDGELKEKRAAMIAQEAQAEEDLRLATEEVNAAKAMAATEAERGTELNQQFEAVAATYSHAVKNLEYYQGKQEELRVRIAEDEKHSADYKALLVAKIEEAKRVCDRETAEGYLPEGGKEMDINSLQNAYERAKRAVEKESRRHARPQDEVMRHLADSKRKFQRLKLTLENARGPCDRLKHGVKHRQRLLRETAKDVNKIVSHRFNYYLGKKGHAGKVDVDYNSATLQLDVKMHGQGQTVKDTRSMSGGERSYSTLALTLSLGESVESPFRAMDEFDVFMDAVNRKVSMDALIEFARDSNNIEKQFLFITPQDISAVDASASDIKVQKMKAARPS